MRSKSLVLLLLFGFARSAATDDNGRGARWVALANASCTLALGPWAILHNPAGLADTKDAEVTAFFVPGQFGMSELRTTAAAVAVPTGFGSIGFSADEFGFDLYRELNVALGIGSRLDANLALGITVRAQKLVIQRYGAAFAMSLDAGALGTVADDLHIGFDWKNFADAGIGMSRERLPQIVSIGVSYECSDASRIALELEKDIRYPFIVKMGFEQSVLKCIALRFGVSNNPDKFSAGFGARYSGFEFSYAGYSHPQLGWTHQIELTYFITE